MELLFGILGGLCTLGWVVCFILVLMKMFQHGDSTLAIVSIVLSLCCGVGSLVAFVAGWMKVGVYGVQNIMMAWTGFYLGSVLFGSLSRLAD